jgi:hypothetical protein
MLKVNFFYRLSQLSLKLTHIFFKFLLNSKKLIFLYNAKLILYKTKTNL